MGLVAALATEGLWRVDLLPRVETVIQDRWHIWYGEREDAVADAPVLLVAVDDESLERLPDPFVFWGPLFAEAFETLRDNGSTAIGLDFLVKVSGEDFFARHGLDDIEASRSWDTPLRRQVLEDDVVLVSTLVESGDGASIDLPLGEYAMLVRDPEARLGLDNLPLDSDNVVRRFWPVVAPGAEGPSRSLALALALTHLDRAGEDGPWEIAGETVPADGGALTLVFSGPPGSVARLPFWKLVEPGALTDEDRALIAGRVAVVGAAFTNAADTLPTPFDQGAFSEPMFGAEVHANAVATLLSGARIWTPSPATRLAIFFLTGVGAAALFFRVNLPAAMALAASMAAWPMVGSEVFFRGLDAMIPTTSMGLTGLLAFAGAYGLRFSAEREARETLSRALAHRVVPDAAMDSAVLASLAGERREVAVLVVSRGGFEALSGSPRDVVSKLNAWFAAACPEVTSRGGSVERFAGGGFTAVFGAPLPLESPAAEALAAAVAIAALPIEAGLEPRALVHVGEAVVGAVGFGSGSGFSVFGGAVSQADALSAAVAALGWTVAATRLTLDASWASFKTGGRTESKIQGAESPFEVVEILVGDSENTSEN